MSPSKGLYVRMSYKTTPLYSYESAKNSFISLHKLSIILEEDSRVQEKRVWEKRKREQRIGAVRQEMAELRLT